MLGLVFCTIYDRTGATVQILDASPTDFVNPVISYELTPSGCGAASLDFGLSYETVSARGYWAAPNIVEVSSADDTLQLACASGATKLYVSDTRPYDTGQGRDPQQIVLYDGVTKTMRIPVTGVGTDASGSYVTVGAPTAGGGNPTTIPAYAAGTLIGRRRYAGRIVRRERANQRNPRTLISCEGLINRLNERIGTFTFGSASNTDVGAAVYLVLSQFSSSWPETPIVQANFPTIGTVYTGTRDRTPALKMVQEILTAIAGDQYVLRVGADRAPRLVKTYTQSSNTYTYNITLPQGVTNYEPQSVQIIDQDASLLYNSIEVIGDQSAATKVPARAIVQDATSISNYGQRDQSPQTNTSAKVDSDAARFAQALLNQNSAAKTVGRFRIFTRYDGTTPGPIGLPIGDALDGLENITITRFDASGRVSNAVPDSEILYGSGPTALWTGGSGMSVSVGGGPNGSNAFTATASTAFTNSGRIDVALGQVWQFDAYLDASAITAGSIQWQVVNEQTSAVIASVSLAAAGTGQRIAGSFTVPTGCMSVHLTPSMNGATGTGKFAQPNANRGSTLKAYVPNYGAPNQFGLVSSAKTTMTPVEMYTDVQFQAIEPDWNAIVAERANALATSLLQNTTTQPALDQYCVSSDAQNFSTSSTSLVVTTPQFLALFAQGSSPLTMPAGSFTCVASATNWVWLTPSLTWTVNQDPHTVAGAILVYIAQASATGVVGCAVRAAIGIPTLPIPAAIKVTGPNVTTSALGTVVGSGAGAYSQPFSFTLGDWAAGSAPGWFDGLQVFYRVHGDTNTHLGPAVALSSTVSYNATLGGLGAGTTYDIGLAYIGKLGDITAIVWPAALQNASTTPPQISPPTAIAGTGGGNLIPDAQLAHRISASVGSPYWFSQLLDGASFSVTVGNQYQPFNLFSWTSGANGSTRYSNSQPFQLVAGVTYTASLYVNLINATGSGGMKIVGPISGTVTNANPNTSAASIASVTQTAGRSSDVSTTFTPTTTGLYVAQVSNVGITVGGSAIFMSRMQVELGSAFTGFKPSTPVQTQGADTGTTSHLVASVATQATITPTAASDGSYLASSVITRRTHGGFIGLGGNFLYNPTAGRGIAGWGLYNTVGANGVAVSDPSYTSGRFYIAISAGANSGTDTLLQQSIPNLLNGATYTVSGFIECDGANAGGFVAVDITTLGTGGSSGPGVSFSASTNGPRYFEFQFTNGNPQAAGGPYIRLRANCGNTSPTVATIGYFYRLKVEIGGTSSGYSDDISTHLVTQTHDVNGNLDHSRAQSGKLLPHVNHSTGVTNVLDANGRAPKSSFLNAQGSIPPYTTDFVIHYASPTGASYVQYWIDNGTAGVAPTFYLPDGSNVTTATLGSSSAPQTFNVAATGDTAYFLVYWNGSGWVVNAQDNAQFTPAQIRAAYQDGYIATVSSKNTKAAGSGTSTGGGCPAIGQKLWRRRNGKRRYVCAENVAIGDELLDWSGEWNRVHAVGISNAQLWEIAFDTETVRVDASHLFLVPQAKAPARYVNVKDLRIGDRLVRYLAPDEDGPQSLAVMGVRCIGEGQFVHITCERHRYVLGKTVSHNIKQYVQ